MACIFSGTTASIDRRESWIALRSRRGILVRRPFPALPSPAFRLCSGVECEHPSAPVLLPGTGNRGNSRRRPTPGAAERSCHTGRDSGLLRGFLARSSGSQGPAYLGGPPLTPSPPPSPARRTPGRENATDGAMPPAGFEAACKTTLFRHQGPHRGPHALARISRALGEQGRVVEFRLVQHHVRVDVRGRREVPLADELADPRPGDTAQVEERDAAVA